MSSIVLFLASSAYGQAVGSDGPVLPVPESSVVEPRRGPDRKSYEALGTLQRLYEQEAAGNRATQEEVENLREQLRRANLEAIEGHQNSKSGTIDGGSSNGLDELTGEELARPVDAIPLPGAPQPSTGNGADFLSGLKRPKVGDKVGATPVRTGPQPMVFSVPSDGARKVKVLPAGSYVKTRILTGVEAGDSGLIPMTLQADYAASGPNGSRIELKGCMLIAQVRGELSTDRVVGKAVRLSCVRRNGELADIEIDGYLAGEDSTLGIVGKLISRQGRVLAAATIANLAQGAGAAVAAANTTSTVIQNPLGGASGQATNVTGNQAAYVVGSSVAGAAEDIADWYLDYAKKLTPAIAVGSGRDVWVVLLEPVEFPGLD